LIPLLAAFCAQQLGWRYALYIPGVIGIGVGLMIMNRLRDTPQSLGLPSVEKFRHDHPSEEAEKELSVREVLVDYVLNNKYIWILASAYFFVYIVRQAVNDWSFMYFTEYKGYGDFKAGACVSWFEVGGFFGSLVAGWGSDYLFSGRRGPINVLFSAGLAFAVAALWYMPFDSVIADSLSIFTIGFFVFGPQLLIGVAAAELSHKKAAATATGFAGLFAYTGAAMAGMPLGKVIRDMGWESFFVALVLCSATASLLLLPLWSATKNPKYQD
jgi:OPA family sugar phosphate sensor protein UhpC-like MFS transporter